MSILVQIGLSENLPPAHLRLFSELQCTRPHSLPVWGSLPVSPLVLGQISGGLRRQRKAEQADGDIVFIMTFTDQAKVILLIMKGTQYTIDLCPSNSQVIIGHRSN